MENFEIESLWCTKIGDNYVVDNIPFIAKRISFGDTITAEYDENEDVYYFDDFVRVSGNSTIRLYFSEDKLIEKVRKDLSTWGIESEVFLLRKIVALNVPKEVDYKPIKEYLEDGEKRGLWTYEESCLAHNY